MNLKVGLYFRTKGGIIGKIDSMSKDGSEIYFDTKPIFSDKEEVGSKWCYANDIKKASHNIIDLIEVGDYVNGILVAGMNMAVKPTPIPQYWNEQNNELEDIDEGDIKTILTKEQFENNCYKIGD